MQRVREIVKISLGADALNELLGGGIESKCITEVIPVTHGATHFQAQARTANLPVLSNMTECQLGRLAQPLPFSEMLTSIRICVQMFGEYRYDCASLLACGTLWAADVQCL